MDTSFNIFTPAFTCYNVTKFHLQFNQYKSNIKLYGEGKRGFKQEKLIEHFFCPNHSVTHKDISVQVTAIQMTKKDKRIFGFIYCLDTMFPKGLNQKKLLRYN